MWQVVHHCVITDDHCLSKDKLKQLFYDKIIIFWANSLLAQRWDCCKTFVNVTVSNLLVKQRCVFKQFIAINDNLEVDSRVFISNNQNGGEGKTAERQRERESERQCVAEKSRIASVIKWQLEETFGDGHVRLINESVQMLLMTCFPRFTFSLEISRRHLDWWQVASSSYCVCF
jgi:hypothetical protein